MEFRGRRLKYKPKKSDLLFLIGASSFVSQVISDHVPSNNIIIASLLLMGVSVGGRVVGNGNGNGKDKP